MMKRITLFAAVASIVAGAALAQDGKVDSAITMMKVLDRPGQIKLATVWDGNKYIQCRQMNDHSVRCEAGGSLMQPSLEHVLTPDRIARLTARGWSLDPSFGNYVRTFPASTPSGVIADEIVATLSQVYDADIANLEVQTKTVADEPCPPRNGWTQNLAGSINDAKSMARYVVHACSYIPPSDESERKLGPNSTVADLIALYEPRVAVEIERLRLNIHRRVFAVFGTDLGYIQCESETEPDGFYCEAQSADSWPVLAQVLTPERIARLHAAGYADPGRAPNYSKEYLADKVTDAELATEILTLLHDVYGYYGATKLDVKTEESRS